ncbi:hypothetical protein L207DRAFT_590734, partial [Hyaloscypha variabilis F]
PYTQPYTQTVVTYVTTDRGNTYTQTRNQPPPTRYTETVTVSRGNPPLYTTQYTQYTTQYTQQRTSTYWSKPAYTTVYRTYRPPPPRSTTYIATTEVYTTFYQPTTVITYYQPLPTPQSHSTYHRSENTYTTIYAPATTYYVPVYVEPPTTSTSTEYVYQTYVAPTVTAASATAVATGGALNPWQADCPVPTTFYVNDFSFSNNSVILTVSYNNGTFLCPNTAANIITYNGIYDMYCDDDGLVRVLTDGFSWIWISQWSWCGAIPTTTGDPVLEAVSNYTTFGDTLDCDQDDNGNTIDCLQNTVNFAIPVQTFDIGGSIGFEPLDVQGNYLPNCPTYIDAQPIVTNTATCNGPSTITAAASSTAASGGGSTIYLTVTVG